MTDVGLTRIRLMQGVLLLVFLVFTFRVASMQWLNPRVPPEYGEGLAPRLVEIEPPRGLIVDRYGQVLARNTPEFRVMLIPGELPGDPDDRRSALVTLERLTGIPYADLEAAASSSLAIVDPYAPVLVLDGLSSDQAIQMRATVAGKGGIRIDASPTRAYTAEETLAHILGYVGSIPEDEAAALMGQGYPLDGAIGLNGVESMYEPTLRGDPGRLLVLSDPQGRAVEELAGTDPVPGADVVLSIDLRLQQLTSAALAKGMEAGMAVLRTNTGQERSDPIPGGAALVMDVRTGELLASVSLPSYDPNLFVDGTPEAIADVLTDPARPLIDRTYMEVRSPGSIFKPLVALAALEEGVATEDTYIVSNGAITIRDEYDPNVVYVFRDWTSHGGMDLRRALARSSDVYFYLLVGGYHQPGQDEFEGMGADVLARWARAAGFGRATGIDLPGEASGLVPTTKWKEEEFGVEWLLGDSYPYSIGQGYLTVTPMQMAVLAAAIANGGTLLQPRVVHGYAADGVVTPLATQTTGRLPGSAEHYRIVREGMRDAASGPDGTAETGKPEGVTIGGKTGTTEFGVAYPDGEYDTHGWYMGFAPYDDPEVAVIVYLEYGVGQTYAGPVAKEILEGYFALKESGEEQRVEARP